MADSLEPFEPVVITGQHPEEGKKPKGFPELYLHGMALSDIRAEVSEAVHRGVSVALSAADERRFRSLPQMAVEARNIQADGAGAATLTFEGPREGTHWKIERVTTDGTAGSCALFIGAALPADLVDNFPSIIKGIHDYSHAIFVAANQPIVAVFAGLPALGFASINFQFQRVPGKSGAN